jgi:peroxiredoxin
MSHKAAQESRTARKAMAQAALHGRDHRGIRAVVVTLTLVVLAGVVAAMLLTSRPESSAAVHRAPAFTLPDTSGGQVSLSQYRGKNVVLYFSEGAGCQSCLVQMGEIERHARAFAARDVVVLPIVMNTRDQITHDMAVNGVRTPFLLDDGTVSEEYGTLGRGMHPGLPGHSFVLIDKQGRQRWYGEYPSMWLAPRALLRQIESHLDG